MQGFFLFNKLQFFLFKISLFIGNLGINTNLAIGFLLLLLSEFTVLDVETFKGCLGQLDRLDLVLLFDLKIFLCLLGLAFQCFQLVVDLKQEVLNPGQILLCCIQFEFGLFFSGFVDADAGSLFQHFPTAVFLVFDDVIHHAQFHDGVAVCADTCIQEEVVDILQTTLNIVQPVLALPAFVKLPGYCYCIELRGQKVLGVVKSKAHLGQTTCSS